MNAALSADQTSSARLAEVPVTMPLPPPADVSSIFRIQGQGRARSAFA